LWPLYACWANFDFSSRPWVRLYLCSFMHTSTGLLVSPMSHPPQSHGILYTHCFVYWASQTGPVFINVQRSACLVLNTVLTLKQFPEHLNFSETPLTYGIMTVPWYIVSEERWSLLNRFIME
jgi:hypothetical protein